MSVAVYESEIPVSVEKLFDFHRQLRLLPRIHPPEMRFEVRNPEVTLAVGSIINLRVRMPPLPFTVNWDAELVELVDNEHFTDVQLRGPFKRWRHVHQFIPVDDQNSRLIDRIEFDTFGGLLDVVGERVTKGRLDWMFQYRHAWTKNILLGEK